MRRNYRKEYDNYQSSPKQRRNNDKRKAARRLMEKEGKVKILWDHNLDEVRGDDAGVNGMRVKSVKTCLLRFFLITRCLIHFMRYVQLVTLIKV